MPNIAVNLTTLSIERLLTGRTRLARMSDVISNVGLQENWTPSSNFRYWPEFRRWRCILWAGTNTPRLASHPIKRGAMER
jgi:hypothetical protein